MSVPSRSMASLSFVLVIGMGAVAVDSMVGVRRGERNFRKKGGKRGKRGKSGKERRCQKVLAYLCPCAHLIPYL